MIPAREAAYPFLATGEFEDLKDAIRVRNESIQTLGNLTLLNKYLNPSASNLPFLEKKSEYKSQCYY